MAFNNVPINGWPQIKGLDNVPEIPGMIEDISALETAVGDSSSGLVKDVTDLKTTVGDSSSGLVKNVSDINTLLNPTAYDTTGLSYIHATYVSGGYLRIGKIIIVNLRISADLESDGEINVTNLPMPIVNNYAVVGAIVTTTTGIIVGGYINSSGALVISTGKVGASYIVSAVYAERTAAQQTREDDQEPADDTKIATKRKKS